MESRGTHRLQLRAVDQIGIVVRDIDKVTESWSSMFGIGPWTIREFSGTDDQGRSSKVRLAFTYLGTLQLELIQVVEGRMFHSDFLDTHGEGLHHLGFSVDDLEGEVSGLVAQGARVLSEGPGTYSYLDTGGPGGVIFELISKPVMDEIRKEGG